MKIIFIGGRTIHQPDGIATWMYNLSTHLVKLGHTPIVYCESDRNEEEWVTGFLTIHRKSIKNRYLCKPLLSLCSTIHSLVKHKNAVVYHYNGWGPALWSWIPLLFGKKSLMQGHGLEWKRTKYSSFQQKIMKFMERVTAWQNPNIIMVSQEQTDFFLSEYGKKCITIPSAVNIPDFNFEQSDILDRYSLMTNGYFLYLARLVEEKNPDYLIKAFIKSNVKDKKLVIAGSNDANPQYVQYLHNLAKDNKNIIFTGAVFGTDKATLLNNCFVFCIPSTLEGLSIALLEAMSYQKPVLASDIPANREGLGNSGIWIEPENTDDLSDKLKYCIENTDILDNQAKQNYQRIAENFTWEIVTKKYIEYLIKLWN